MATVKNYGLAGVGQSVQFGKAGGSFKWQPTGGTEGTGASFAAVGPGGATLVPVRGAAGINGSDYVTLSQLQTADTGLTPKPAVAIVIPEGTVLGQWTDDAGGTFAGNGANSSTLTIDGVDFEPGDTPRVLIRWVDITVTGGGVYAVGPNASQNGIYVLDVTTGVYTRASDSDAQGEVNYNNYVFCSGGTNEGDSYVISKVVPTAASPLVLNTDPVTWVKYSDVTVYTASNGVTLDSITNNFRLNIASLDTQATISTDSTFAFGDAVFNTSDQQTTIGTMFNTLDVVRSNGITDGILVKTGDDAYAGRAITVSTADNLIGLSVTNGNGVAANPVLGLDIIGTAVNADPLALADTFLIYDLSTQTNKAATIQQVADAVSAASSANIISQDNSSVIVTDTGNNGTITITADGTAVASFTSAGAAITGNLSATGNVSGVDGAFSGDVTAASVDTGTGAISGGAITGTTITGTSLTTGTGSITGGTITGTAIVGGTVAGTTGTFSGNVSAVDGTFSGNVAATGNVSGVDGAFSGDVTAATVTATGAVEGASLTATGLTAGSVVIVGTGGLLTEDAQFVYNATSDTLTLGNFALNGTSQTITGTTTDGNINIVPNGTGEVVIGSAGAGVISADTGQTLTITSDTGLVLDATAGGVSVTDLTVANGVVFADGTVLSQDAGFSYDATTDTLTVGNISLTGGIDINLAPTEVVFGSATGSTETSSELTFVTGTSTLGTVNIAASGDITAATLTTTGAITGTTITGTAISGTTGTYSGAVTAASLNTSTGAISGGAITGSSVTDTALITTTPAVNVVYASIAGELEVDDIHPFTYEASSGTLTVNQINAAGGIDLDLTENELVYGDANGVPVSSAAFVVDPGASTLSIGTISINGTGTSQTISGSETNGNINIVPDGTGEVVIGGASSGIAADTGNALVLSSDTGITLDAATTVTDLTVDGGIVFTDASGLLTQDGTFTFDGTTLTVDSISAGSIDLSLPATEIVFGGVGGVTATSPNLTFANDTLTTVDIAAANGSFSANIDAVDADFSGDVTAASVTTASVTANASALTLESTGNDIAVVLADGKLVLVTNDIDYNNALANNTGNALITKAYAQTLIQSGAAAESVKTVMGTVSLAANGTTAIGAALPAGATVLSVKVNVTTADASATLDIGDGTTADVYMTDTENDPQSAGIYMTENFVTNGSALTVTATVVGSTGTGTGSADVIVEYRVPA